MNVCANRKSQITSAFLAALMVTAGAPPARAGCACGQDTIEIVFVIDATGSMNHDMATIKAQAAKILSVVAIHAGEVRVGMVAFRTNAGPEFDIRSLPLSADQKRFARELRKLTYRGGGQENVDRALEAAVSSMRWSRGARKLIVLMGDEAPHPDRVGDMMAAARAAKARGIVIHAVTGVRMAWNLHIDKQGYRRRHPGVSDAVIRRTFTLPVFDRAAEITGGRSVSMSSTREVVRAMLAFALGRRAAENINVAELIQRQESELETGSKKERQTGRALLGRLSFKGDWNRPFSPDALLADLKGQLHLEYERGARILSARDDLSGAPVLLLSGESAIGDLDGKATAGVRRHLDAGGFLLGSACCGSRAFDRSFRAFAGRLYPGKKLARLDAGHPIFRAGFDIRRIRYTAGHRVAKFKARAPELWGLTSGGRLKIAYTPHSLGHTWRTRPFEPPCMMHDEDGRRLTLNIMLYAMQ